MFETVFDDGLEPPVPSPLTPNPLPSQSTTKHSGNKEIDAHTSQRLSVAGMRPILANPVASVRDPSTLASATTAGSSLSCLPPSLSLALCPLPFRVSDKRKEVHAWRASKRGRKAGRQAGQPHWSNGSPSGETIAGRKAARNGGGKGQDCQTISQQQCLSLWAETGSRGWVGVQGWFDDTHARYLECVLA